MALLLNLKPKSLIYELHLQTQRIAMPVPGFTKQKVYGIGRIFVLSFYPTNKLFRLVFIVL